MNRMRLLFITLLAVLTTTAYGQKKGSYDEKAGAEAAEAIATQMGLVEDEALVAYVTQVGERLVAKLEDPHYNYTFFVVDMPEPNAFSLPGGYTYVSRGLLAILNSEDQLAGVMGHEIIHAHNRHSYKQMKRSIFPALLQIPGNVVGAVNEDFGNMINAPIGAASKLGLASYSRKHEYEADEEGLKLASAAGYDPLALGEALQNITNGVQFITGKAEEFKYTDDHPFTPDRLEKIQKISADLNWERNQPIATNREQFYSKVQGIYIGQNPAGGIFKDGKFYQAELNMGITFPDGWQGVNQPSYVGASEPEGKAVIIWGILGEAQDPHAIASEFTNKLRQKYQIQSFKSKEMNINGIDAHIFAIDEETRGKVTNMTVVWLNHGGLLYQMIASGAKDLEKQFIACAESFHGLSDDERNSIAGIVLRVAKADGTESIEDLSQRSDNVLNPDFIAIINELEKGSSLSDGQAVKIGRSEKYIPVN